MSKKVLILGANGMAGHVLTKGLKEDENFQVISIARNKSVINPTYLFDISDFNKLSEIILGEKPDIIINCIGLLNKSAEVNPSQAILINAYLPHFIENLTKNTLTKLIHISTDCVFSGEEGSYTEKSFKNGIGYYSQSKSLGEINNSKDLTFRTSIIGPELNKDGIGLFHWLVNQNSELTGFTRAHWTGITTVELLNAIKAAIFDDLKGLYHLVNNKKITKFSLLKIINQEFSLGLKIIPTENYLVDKSLVNTRDDFSFTVKSYKKMILEMKDWIILNKQIYPHYREKLF
jgi:dTDP-4-dehydrorhamnose reductase